MTNIKNTSQIHSQMALKTQRSHWRRRTKVANSITYTCAPHWILYKDGPTSPFECEMCVYWRRMRRPFAHSILIQILQRTLCSLCLSQAESLILFFIRNCSKSFLFVYFYYIFTKVSIICSFFLYLVEVHWVIY